MTDQPKPQVDNFRDLARKLGCDEDEASFEDKVRKVAGKTAPDGEWKVEPAKVGQGYKAKFYPTGYAPSPEGPTFPTPEEAQAWADSQT
jgi:hypothetical protein